MGKMYLNGHLYGGVEIRGDFIRDLLYENTDFTVASGTSDSYHTYDLSSSIENYDAVLVTAYLHVTSSGKDQVSTMLVLKPDYYNAVGGYWTNGMHASFGGAIRRFYFYFPNANQINTMGNRNTSGEEPKLYKVYGLKFGIGHHTYSTDEQIVGTWVDGSAIYEKTFLITVNNSSSSGFTREITESEFGLSYSSISNFISISGHMYNNVVLPRNRIKSTWSENIYISDNKIQFESSHPITDNAPVYITVQYTKTTS